MPAKRPKPPASADDRRLRADGALLHRALSELVRVYQFRDRERISYHGITVTQCYALAAIVAREDLTLNRLAGALRLDKSTASRLVDALEEKGLVKRRADAEDARRIALVATAKGRRLHGRIEESMLDEELGLYRDFDPKARAAAAEIMTRLARLARERFSGENR